MAQNHLRIADGYSSNKLAAVLNTTPSGMEYALAVRIIGGATITGGGTSSLFTAPFPPSGTAAGFNDGTNMQGAMVYDTNLSPATEWTLGVNLRQSGPTGSVEVGTQSNPLFVDTAPDMTFQHINTASTTIVLNSSPGVLKRVLVTSSGKTGAITTIYDNTAGSGEIIAVINTSSVIGELPFDVTYDIGLTVVTSSLPPGDITIIYK